MESSVATSVPVKKKRSMFLKILMVLGVLLVVFLIIVAMQEDDYRVERSAKISASQAALFNQVNDLHEFQTWNPWGKIDPNVKITYEGPQAGVGSVYKWVGNSEVGEGKMTITESRPNELVKMRLDFYEPFAGTADSEFTMKPEGGQTVLTWSMVGKKNFMSKAISMFMSMDKMIGGQFEKGLTDLKLKAEGTAK
jgi:hypothetical protein